MRFAVQNFWNHRGADMKNQKHKYDGSRQTLQDVHPVPWIVVAHHIGFGAESQVKAHQRVEQKGNKNEPDFNAKKKRQVVDEIDTQLILPHANGTQGVDGKMDDKKSPDRNDPGEGMNFQKEKMQLVFIWFCHLLGQLKREDCARNKVLQLKQIDFSQMN